MAQAAGRVDAKYLKKDFDPAVWERFAGNLFYVPATSMRREDFDRLSKRLTEIESSERGGSCLLRVDDATVVRDSHCAMGRAGLADDSSGARRIVLEKPFGTDRATARGS